MAISFQIQEVPFKLTETVRTKTWIKTIIELEKKKTGQLNFVLTNDEAVLKTNIHYLKHNTYTDIITFDYCEDKIINGDIIISIDRVAENANTFKVPFKTELNRVLIHGVLHLCGYGDKTKVASELMRKKENWALKKF